MIGGTRKVGHHDRGLLMRWFARRTPVQHAPLEAQVQTDKRVRDVDLWFSPPAYCAPYASTVSRWNLPSAARETSNPRTSRWTA